MFWAPVGFENIEKSIMLSDAPCMLTRKTLLKTRAGDVFLTFKKKYTERYLNIAIYNHNVTYFYTIQKKYFKKADMLLYGGMQDKMV